MGASAVTFVYKTSMQLPIWGITVQDICKWFHQSTCPCGHFGYNDKCISLLLFPLGCADQAHTNTHVTMGTCTLTFVYMLSWAYVVAHLGNQCKLNFWVFFTKHVSVRLFRLHSHAHIFLTVSCRLFCPRTHKLPCIYGSNCTHFCVLVELYICGCISGESMYTTFANYHLRALVHAVTLVIHTYLSYFFL